MEGVAVLAEGVAVGVAVSVAVLVEGDAGVNDDSSLGVAVVRELFFL